MCGEAHPIAQLFLAEGKYLELERFTFDFKRDGLVKNVVFLNGYNVYCNFYLLTYLRRWHLKTMTWKLSYTVKKLPLSVSNENNFNFAACRLPCVFIITAHPPLFTFAF